MSFRTVRAKLTFRTPLTVPNIFADPLPSPPADVALLLRGRRRLLLRGAGQEGRGALRETRLHARRRGAPQGGCERETLGRDSGEVVLHPEPEGDPEGRGRHAAVGQLEQLGGRQLRGRQQRQQQRQQLPQARQLQRQEDEQQPHAADQRGPVGAAGGVGDVRHLLAVVVVVLKTEEEETTEQRSSQALLLGVPKCQKERGGGGRRRGGRCHQFSVRRLIASRKEGSARLALAFMKA